MRNKGIISLLILILMAVSINAQTLTVEITNIRNDKGNISLAVFIDNSSFVKEIPFLAKTYSKTNLIDEKLIVKINLKPGVYGISVLDDENKNGEMEYNLIGVPKEGFGFSNYYHRGPIKPKFKVFDFIITDKNKTVYIKMKYM